ncbi:hypothetical protein [Aquimarina brevivitae]|uniref:DUF1579 domain-containing protein n=1 Tax=Aquimarina brevivitae TaxID=323412 RepID=A0A4Q7PMQ0_9FLAO|nr:hypothetical protein [Aquimarina brevivitae]RZT00303.1 hypothetical protein EV197_1539 [Aquimarina brevivitae]
MKTSTTKFIFIYGVISIISFHSTSAQENLEAKYKEFDFWKGEWQVYKHNTDTLVGYNTITTIVDDKALEENYSSYKTNFKGVSLTKYNPKLDRWEQFWVDTSGVTLFLKGNYIDNAMVLQDTTKTSLNKIIWKPINNNEVRQTWYQSNDQGKTWVIVFDGDYKPVK